MDNNWFPLKIFKGEFMQLFSSINVFLLKTEETWYVQVKEIQTGDT